MCDRSICLGQFEGLSPKCLLLELRGGFGIYLWEGRFPEPFSLSVEVLEKGEGAEPACPPPHGPGGPGRYSGKPLSDATQFPSGSSPGGQAVCPPRLQHVRCSCVTGVHRGCDAQGRERAEGWPCLLKSAWLAGA